MKLFKKGQKVLHITPHGIDEGETVVHHTKDELKVVSPGSVSTMSSLYAKGYVLDNAHNRKVALMYNESVALSKKQLAHIETLFK